MVETTCLYCGVDFQTEEEDYFCNMCKSKSEAKKKAVSKDQKQFKTSFSGELLDNIYKASTLKRYTSISRFIKDATIRYTYDTLRTTKQKEDEV